MLRRLLSMVLILCLLSGCMGFADAESELPVDTEVSYRHLRRGDSDGDDSSEILNVQNRLRELGYLRSKADGVFGGDTINAVREFQRSNRLEETGEASSELQKLLFSDAELVPAPKTADPNSVAYRVQASLGMWGFMVDEPDGIIGDGTGEAMEMFKEYLKGYRRAHPMPTPVPTDGSMPLAIDTPIENGLENEITQEILDFVEGKVEFDVFAQELKDGDAGVEVERLQRRLHQLKYLALVNGTFDETTMRALMYFQRKMNFPQTGGADEATQRALFSADAAQSEEYVNLYKLIVDVSEQRVYVFQWNGSNYGTVVGEMVCSTGMRGKATETPLGTYQAAGPTGTGEWYWFSKYECYAKWATRIIGGILFHSVVYNRNKVLNRTSLNKLGRPASHGCVRLRDEHAKWIYENCVPGTTVLIQK